MAKQVSVRLEEHEVAQLNNAAKMLGVSRSALIKQAVELLLEQLAPQGLCGPEVTSQPGRRAAGSLEKAQELVYDALEASHWKEAEALAVEALKLSSDCVDAYTLLAQLQETPGEAMELYRQGIAAGKRVLGEKFIEEEAGFFWGLLETRPYMRALEGLALTLLDLGREDESVNCFSEMLRLNPNDNQGVRYSLLPLLIEMGRYDEARDLYIEYEDDGMACWTFSKALLDFAQYGDSPTARKALSAAVKANEHVSGLLLGEVEMPDEHPGSYGLGDVDEAVVYADCGMESWNCVKGALDWLRKNC